MLHDLPGMTLTPPAPVPHPGAPQPPAEQPAARRRADFTYWHWVQQRVGDSDPNYPVFKEVGQALGGKEATADLLFRMLTFYDIGSALASAAEAPPFHMPDSHQERFPIGHHRRGNRYKPRFRAQWASLLDTADKYGGPVAWFTPTQTGHEGWEEMEQRALEVHEFGRYFSYKVAEFAQVIMDADIEAPNAQHKNSKSVRKGLAHLYPDDVPNGNTRHALDALDSQTRQLATLVQQPNLARLETALCSIKTAINGKCYIGWEIDEQLAKLNRTPSDLTPAAMVARTNNNNPAYLGELNGWSDVDRPRLKVYKQTGQILER